MDSFSDEFLSKANIVLAWFGIVLTVLGVFATGVSILIGNELDNRDEKKDAEVANNMELLKQKNLDLESDVLDRRINLQDSASIERLRKFANTKVCVVTDMQANEAKNLTNSLTMFLQIAGWGIATKEEAWNWNEFLDPEYAVRVKINRNPSNHVNRATFEAAAALVSELNKMGVLSRLHQSRTVPPDGILVKVGEKPTGRLRELCKGDAENHKLLVDTIRRDYGWMP